jgi:hypothetical protein
MLRTRTSPILRLHLCCGKPRDNRWGTLSKAIPLLPHRTYASKSKQKSTATLVPGSKQPITNETARQEYAKAEERMQAAVEWYRRDCASVETRASGRVTAELLSPVRVILPESKERLRLEEVATVGVREGSTLLVTVFDEGVSIPLVRHDVGIASNHPCPLVSSLP